MSCQEATQLDVVRVTLVWPVVIEVAWVRLVVLLCQLIQLVPDRLLALECSQPISDAVVGDVEQLGNLLVFWPVIGWRWRQSAREEGATDARLLEPIAELLVLWLVEWLGLGVEDDHKLAAAQQGQHGTRMRDGI